LGVWLTSLIIGGVLPLVKMAVYSLDFLPIYGIALYGCLLTQEWFEAEVLAFASLESIIGDTALSGSSVDCPRLPDPDATFPADCGWRPRTKYG
jgi:hypothetical protein